MKGKYRFSDMDYSMYQNKEKNILKKPLTIIHRNVIIALACPTITKQVFGVRINS